MAMSWHCHDWPWQCHGNCSFCVYSDVRGAYLVLIQTYAVLIRTPVVLIRAHWMLIEAYVVLIDTNRAENETTIFPNSEFSCRVLVGLRDSHALG